MQYPKIKNVYARNLLTREPIDELYSTPEIEYLADYSWRFTEKIHGTNVRIEYDPKEVNLIKGKTEKSILPQHLLNYLLRVIDSDKMETLFKDTSVFNPSTGTVNYEGEFRGPYYAGMDPILCEDCHDPHGSTNQYHLKEKINWLTDITTSYQDVFEPILPNVCGSCHRFYHDVPGSYGCVYCHFHGAKADTEPTTNF